MEGFFSVEPVYEPGTHFTYNTGASCMLCSVVEKVTGMDFFDFACAIAEKLGQTSQVAALKKAMFWGEK